MEEKIEKYLIEEKKVESKIVREMLIAKVMKHDDIVKEFGRWLDERKYAGEVEIGGYNAERIYELAPQLDGIGVYNFLVTLRDDPDEAKKIIADGFKVY